MNDEDTRKFRRVRKEKGLRGRSLMYPGELKKPRHITLTDEAFAILKKTAKEEKLTKSECIERWLRHKGNLNIPIDIQ